MTLNNVVVILRKGAEVGTYNCHAYAKTRSEANTGGFVYQNEISCRIPLDALCANVDANVGDYMAIDNVRWKIVGVTVNKGGSNPHVHLTGV